MECCAGGIDERGFGIGNVATQTTGIAEIVTVCGVRPSIVKQGTLTVSEDIIFGDRIDALAGSEAFNAATVLPSQRITVERIVVDESPAGSVGASQLDAATIVVVNKIVIHLVVVVPNRNATAPC